MNDALDIDNLEQITDAKSKNFFRIDKKDEFRESLIALGVIVLAGFIGGWLAEPASAITGAQFPTQALSFWQSVGLGFAAGGIGTLVVANTRRNDKLHLFFFALLCAISFPAVIERAVEDMLEREKDEKVDQIVQSAQTEDLPSIEAAFGTLETSGLSTSFLNTENALKLETGLLQSLNSVEQREAALPRSDTIRVLETARSAGQSAGLKQVEEKANNILVDLGEAVPTGEQR